MATKMKVLLNGYSGFAKLDGHNLLMTSFSLSMNENVINSEGVGRILRKRITTDALLNGYYDVQHVFERYKLNAVRDYPGYDISIGVEANYDILDYLFTKITTNFHSFVELKFTDNASGITYDFDRTCLTSFTLSVGNDSAAMLQLNFITFKDEIDVTICQNGYDEKAIRYAPEEFVGAVLMPYWAWGIETRDIYGNYLNDEDLYDFSITYSQNVNPKYGCFGVNDQNAIKPNKVIFGVPEVKYDLTYVVANSASVSDYLIASNLVSTSGRNMVVKYHQVLPPYSLINQTETKTVDFSFTMTDCYPDSYSPQYANSGDVNKMSVSGTVYGKINYEKIVDEGASSNP